MTQNVSVPEKTLEHWASLCVAYRYRSLAAQWWPVNTQAVLCRTVAGCSPGSAEDVPVRKTGTVGASGSTPSDRVCESLPGGLTMNVSIQ
jgi:hypothetical protein